MHGGLSPDLQSMEQIRRVMRPTDVPDTGALYILQSSLLLTWRWGFRPALRPTMVRSGQRHHRLVRERSRRIVYLRARRRVAFLAEARHGPNLPGTSGVSPNGRRSPAAAYLRGWNLHTIVAIRGLPSLDIPLAKHFI